MSDVTLGPDIGPDVRQAPVIDTPATPHIGYHSIYVFTVLSGNLWSMYDEKSLALQISRQDGQLVDAPTWVRFRVLDVRGSVVDPTADVIAASGEDAGDAGFDMDVQPNNSDTSGIIAAISQLATVVYEFPAPAEFTIEFVTRIGVDNQRIITRFPITVY